MVITTFGVAETPPPLPPPPPPQDARRNMLLVIRIELRPKFFLRIVGFKVFL
jgi:hypothetical protein